MKSEKLHSGERLQSLDTLRGMDMLFIMRGNEILIGLSLILPFPFFQQIAEQTDHVAWNGCHLQDMIFPLFLFIAGISFPLSLASQRRKGFSTGKVIRKIFSRCLKLIILGILYNGFLQFDFENMRFASVLGRIGLAWAGAALIFVFVEKNSIRVLITAFILLFYWLLLKYVPAPDGAGADVFSMEGCLVGWVDRQILPGKLLNGIHDPEGILSTLPAISTALLGMLTGEIVMKKENVMTGKRKVFFLVVTGLALTAFGLIWNKVFPINKNLWSSSFVCFVGGISMVLFALMYYMVDVLKCRKWTLFFRVIGMNSITIYMAQVFVKFNYTSEAIFHGAISFLPDNVQPLFNAIVYIAVCWGFLYFLYRQKIFLKV